MLSKYVRFKLMAAPIISSFHYLIKIEHQKKWKILVTSYVRNGGVVLSWLVQNRFVASN